MSTYPKLNIDPEIWKMNTKDDEIKHLDHKTEKYDHENILKSLKTDKEFYKKKCKPLNEKNY